MEGMQLKGKKGKTNGRRNRGGGESDETPALRDQISWEKVSRNVDKSRAKGRKARRKHISKLF